jgi:multidrug efflux pump subunit AcrA (membrane-fusion protein)
MNKSAPIAFVLLLAGCGRQKVVEARVDPSSHENLPPHHQVRSTGKVRAVRSYAIQVPQIIGQNSSRLTLIKLAANGAEVHEGDVVAEFDGTQEAENACQAQARYDDLSHQVEQKQA